MMRDQRSLTLRIENTDVDVKLIQLTRNDISTIHPHVVMGSTGCQ